MSTPSQLGYTFPAEWSKHEATWIGWPHNASDWPGKMGAIHLVYGEIVRRLATSETVRILVNHKAHQARAEKVLKDVGADLQRVEFLRCATDRGWTRDFGPIFVKRTGGRSASTAATSRLAIADFKFNGWAKYDDWKKDDAVARKMARKLKVRRFEACATAQRPTSNVQHPTSKRASRFVLEGGAIDVNGQGTLITTEECLLDQEVQVRNPGLSKRETEQALKKWLGQKKVIWLGKGIAGDDTHGHVDDLCRFVNAKTLVLCQEKNSKDPNYKPLKENWERLQHARINTRTKPEVIALPMPTPVIYKGYRLPASYANFYIANKVVLVPTFNDPSDRIALGILSELFPTRSVVGIHAVDLVWGLGTLHCLTQQQPAR